MNATQLKNSIEICLLSNLVPYVTGIGGSGKSEIIKDIAKKYNVELIDLRLATLDSLDLTGLIRPNEDNSKASYLPLDYFPLEKDDVPKDKEGWILFLDELSQANRAVQAASFKLILDRQIGKYKLNSKCLIVCAGNSTEESSIANSLPAPLISRMVHLKLDVDLNTWLTNIAYPQKYDTSIIAYLQSKPKSLCLFNENLIDSAYPCPRTWEFVNRIIKQVYANGDKVTKDHLELIAGCIGIEVAQEYIVFVENQDKLPTINEILTDPMNAKIPDNSNLEYILICTLAEHIINNKQDVDVFTYISRFKTSLIALFINTLKLREQSDAFTSTKEYRELLIKIGQVLNEQ